METASLRRRFPVSQWLVAWCLSVGLLAAGTASAAVMSGNILQGGDFEDTGHLKNATAPDGVVPHKFSQTYDLGMWLGHWGPPNNPGGNGGFSTYDDPRNLAETGGDTMSTGNQGNMNRSVDHTNAGNHFMEITMFYPRFVQWIKTPDGHVDGAIRFSYDLLQDDGWVTSNLGVDGAPWGRVYVFGMNTIPSQNADMFDPTLPAPGAPGVIFPVDENINPADGDLIFYNTFGDWLDGSHQDGDPAPPFEYFGVWQHYDTAEYLENEEGSPIEGDGSPDYQWWGGRQVTQEVTQAYPYYAVVIAPFLYSEGDPYFWLHGGKVVDNFTMAFDNFSLQVEIAIPGDFNFSGDVDTEDINPFVLALTAPGSWYDLGRATLGDATLTDQDIIDYADCNGDGLINTEDINPFIIILTSSGQSAIIPEPATFGLLMVGTLGLMRRR